MLKAVDVTYSLQTPKMTKQQAKEKIKDLVKKYQSLTPDDIKKYNEANTRKNFILPLFDILGWDTKSEEVAEEENASGKRVDYGFKINGITKFFLEAKPLSADLDIPKWAEQAIWYAWHKSVPWAILTDFESIKVFNAEWDEPDPENSLFLDIKFDQYMDDFERLWWLSKESFENGVLDAEALKWGKKPKRIPVDKQLSEDLIKWRDILFRELRPMNAFVPPQKLAESIQRILNRLIFIKTVEDRGIEDITLQSLVRSWVDAGRPANKLLGGLKDIFRKFDSYYDSRLFEIHYCDQLTAIEGTFERIINELYKTGIGIRYNFDHINADILGSIYEQYLGHIQKEEEENGGNRKTKRKSQGIYYTPRYIVDYIVNHALGEILKEKSLEEIKGLKVLDPACGSGSFLIRAYEGLINYWEIQINKESKFKKGTHLGMIEKTIKQKKGQKTLSAKAKMNILRNNIYGVDLDDQAVEIAQLNLLLKTVNRRAKLPSLQHILCGNSLISGDEKELKKYFGKNWKTKKPFNWQEKFSEVFKDGGFDIIVGNPPWGANIDNELKFFAENFPNSTKEKKDTYKIFIERSVNLLKPSGIFGFIIPNSFLYQPSYEDIKKFINQYSYFVINLGEKIFENVELPCCILILQKKKLANNFVVDFTKKERALLPDKLLTINLQKEQTQEILKGNIFRKVGLSFSDVFELKDAGIQYHRSGIGLSNKGGSDLYERIFCKNIENRFKEKKGTYYGKLMHRYYISDKTDELFNLNYKQTLNKNESVSFTREAFEKDKKIIWRQTAPTIFATLDDKKRWFRNTIQCGWVKDEYKNKVDIRYALAIFNSKYIDYIYRQRVLETGRVFPQVKIKYLQELPFIIGDKAQQKYLSMAALKILNFNKKLQKLHLAFNDEEYNEIKSEIEKTDKEIDQKVYEIYVLTDEEIKIIEASNRK